MSIDENGGSTTDTKSQNPNRSITELSRERDGLNARLIELGRQTAEADETAGCSSVFFQEAERRELAVDYELAHICATILTKPPTCGGDVVLKARTLTFIADQDHIWDWDKFKDEIVTFAKQVADWADNAPPASA